MRVLDLFSGIGGFSLGLERAGMQTVAFCEIDPYCRRVLAKHWPEVPCYDDIRSVTAARLAADGIVPDVVCGGFPCQDISFAGAGAGLAGARSGLWFEMLRVITETRPRFVIAENVAALRGRGLDVVLGGLAAIGYDAEWHCIPASAVGAPHRRDRVWILAYAHGNGWKQAGRNASSCSSQDQTRQADRPSDASSPLDNAECIGRDAGRSDNRGDDGQQLGATGQHAGAVADAEGADDRFCDAGEVRGCKQQSGNGGFPVYVADSDGEQREGRRWYAEPAGHDKPSNGGSALANAYSIQQNALRKILGRENIQPGGGGCADWWSTEPDVGRVANGVPSRVDRLRCLGNAVVPQIPELIGRAILAAEAACSV